MIRASKIFIILKLRKNRKILNFDNEIKYPTIKIRVTIKILESYSPFFFLFTSWIWWPKTSIDLFPENKWSGSLNMLSRVSRRLINAHQYYTRQLFYERKKNNTNKFDNNYYYQEFFTPTVAKMFNLTMVIYDHSNMDVHVSNLNEDNIRRSLANGKQIFHPVKHDSQLLINATQ